MYVGQIKQENLLGYGHEILIWATYKDIEYLPLQVEIQYQNMLKAVVEGRRPNCHLCGVRGHM